LTDQPLDPEDSRSDPFAIDTDVAHSARMQNYLAGGVGNFAADREAAEFISAVLPGGIETARAAVRSLGNFVGRTVRYLAGELGIRQFLNIGVAVPTEKNVHDVAQQASPDSRFVYVGHDSAVLAHAHSLRKSTEDGATAYIHGTLGDPQAILQQAAATLDLTRPVAIVLLGILNHIHDEDDPNRMIAELLQAVPAGSYLAISHSGNDIKAEGNPESAKRLSKALQEPWVLRNRTEITRFFDGLEMLEPGLTPIDQWAPPGDEPGPLRERPTPIYVAIGRKP
jgi:hypothetical protein